MPRRYLQVFAVPLLGLLVPGAPNGRPDWGDLVVRKLEVAELAKHEFGALIHGGLWQQADVIAKVRKYSLEPLELLYGAGQIMATVTVLSVDFGPRRSEKNGWSVVSLSTKRPSIRHAGRMLQSNGRVDQTSVEEDETGLPLGKRKVGSSHRNRAASKSGHVDPGQCGSGSSLLFGHDAATRLLDNAVPPFLEFDQQCRLAAAGAA